MKVDGATIRQFILARRNHPQRLGIAVVLVVAAGGLRWLVDSGSSGLPFTTFYPAILLAAVLLDWRYALVVSTASVIVIANFLAAEPLMPNYSAQRLALMGLLLLAGALLILTGTMLRRILAESNELMERQSGFNRELQHRIKNSLAIVQALASQASKATDPATFYRDLSGRLAALAKANEMLSLGSSHDCRLPELAREAVAPFNGTDRIKMAGEPCEVPEVTCVPLVMALHELCTNAVKHGALSNDSGRVDLSWRELGGLQLILVWQEQGGPPVLPPTHRGLGSRLLLAQAGIAAVDLDYAETGVRCEFLITGMVRRESR